MTNLTKSKTITSLALSERQKKNLSWKIEASLQRINEWYDKLDGMVYVSFSGGKDSTVLLHLVRSIYPDVQAVFVNTGLEYPEIKEFVRTIKNVVWIRPEKPFQKIIKEYGYPVISKMQAQYIDQYRNGSEHMKELRLNGKVYNGVRNYKISEKWKYMIDAPFKISDKCCEWIKKRPIKKFNKKSGLKPYIGIMASDSVQRKKQYLQHGCNAFDLGVSRPLSFWLEEDIWGYIKQEKISYCSVYDNGLDRTGCMFCMFGVHLDSPPNRFQIMKITHPTQYNYCMEKLGIAEVLEYIKVQYK